MKEIEYDKRATYIGTIHSKCFRVLRISIVFYYKITYMKQIEYDTHECATYVHWYVLSILNVLECQGYPLSSIRLHT